ncbi:DUF6080 domain-containing protein [Chryseobacterium elymi]|uniref:DUF6080 domain-containing protein n=1 Tax=Chryseobacterium elymi TaxID=395936 RepID=UPI001EE8EA2F|nr:DUF6080 domain-containing protein [Chryseobacterium elymi]
MSFIKTKLTSLLKQVFPSSYTELAVFMFFLLCYGILGTYIALHYRIIFDSRIPWDAYFSFDNKAIVMTGGSFERHPLAYYFFNWVREFSLFVSGGKMDATFRLTLAWLSNIAISLCIVQIFKYLKNIIRLPLKISLLIILFFGFCSTNIILSFTPENFTYTLLLLCIYNYYAAIKLSKEGKIPGSALTLAGITIGGLTITNLAKVFIPVLFEKNVFRSWKKFRNAVFRVVITTVCFVFLYLLRIDFEYKNIFSKTNQQYEKFSNVESIPDWDMMLSYFFGGSILFPSFITTDKHNMKGFNFKGLLMEPYSSSFCYAFIIILLVLILWSYFKNFRNKLVQIIAFSFLFDIVIHCIMRFGLHTSYIYGGHFIFVYPLLLGWLFYAYRSKPKISSFLMVTMVILFSFLLTNNIFRMSDFFQFLNTYYQ